MKNAPRTRDNARDQAGTIGKTRNSQQGNSTAQDPLMGWFSLAENVKTSRNRQQKRCWNRGAK
jgi:hypothetical protein